MTNSRIDILSSTVRLLVAVSVVVFPAAATMESCSLEIGLPPRDVHRSAAAATLSRLVYEMGDEPVLTEEHTALLQSNGFSAPKHFVTRLDRGLGARHGNDYCMMAFRGTVMLQPKDVLSNLDMKLIEFTSIAQDYYDDYDDNDDDLFNINGTAMSCDLHQGYYDAYIKFKDEMEDYLDTCVSECPECDVVLTGHSQGGGISEIYALLHKKRFLGNNESSPPPYVITFGGVRSLGKGCMRFISKEERCRHYHYLMGTTGILGNTLDFDYIPTLIANSYFKAREEGYTAEYYYVRNGVAAPGHMILVSSDDPLSSYYLGFDGNYTYKITDLPIGFNLKSHDKQRYMDVLNTLGDNYATNSQPLPTNGFSLDTVCDTGIKLCHDGLECQKVGLREICRPIGENSSSGSRIQGGLLSMLMVASIVAGSL